MREDTFLSTIEPYWIDPDAWWRDTPVDNIEALAPDKKKILLIIGDSRHVMDDLIRFVKFGVGFQYDVHELFTKTGRKDHAHRSLHCWRFAHEKHAESSRNTGAADPAALLEPE
jgi:hypothetical protein